MTSDQAKPLIASAVRHGLTLLAGYLVTRGAFSPTTAGGFVEGLSGVLVGLIGFGWSMARAGRLGSQAVTICNLVEQLANSIPASIIPTVEGKRMTRLDIRPSISQAPATQEVDPTTGWPVGTTVNPATGEALPPIAGSLGAARLNTPDNPWPLGHVNNQGN